MAKRMYKYMSSLKRERAELLLSEWKLWTVVLKDSFELDGVKYAAFHGECRLEDRGGKCFLIVKGSVGELVVALSNVADMKFGSNKTSKANVLNLCSTQDNQNNKPQKTNDND